MRATRLRLVACVVTTVSAVTVGACDDRDECGRDPEHLDYSCLCGMVEFVPDCIDGKLVCDRSWCECPGPDAGC
jgi:hypothetical protein